MKVCFSKNCGGSLSREDIIREIKAKRLVIQPSNDSKIKAASFDISPSCLVMSVRSGSFMRIHSNISRCEKGHRNPEWHCNSCRNKNRAPAFCPEQKYVYIAPRDTALILSREYIQLPETMCGSVVSRVSTVSNGLGHISTTIDPLWKGALLIAISNPSSEPKKLMIKDETSAIPLATVTLQYLNTPVKKERIHTTHLPARVDILEKYLYDVSETKNRCSLVKNFFYKLMFTKDYNLTVRIIDRLKCMTDIDPQKWPKELEDLEKEVCGQKLRGNTWRTNLQRVGRWVSILFVIAILCVLACIIFQCYVTDEQRNFAFVSALIVAVVQCLISIIINI